MNLRIVPWYNITYRSRTTPPPALARLRAMRADPVTAATSVAFTSNPLAAVAGDKDEYDSAVGRFFRGSSLGAISMPGATR